jgi:hypothetical protein
MIQRETAEVAARWQEQVQQSRNAGMDFSPRQKQEMKELDATFRKNVLNGPYDEGLKQRAMLEHQKKLAAIVPEDKVENPQEGLNSSLIFHEPTNSWYMQGRDSKGFPTFQPIGSGGDDQGRMQQLQMQQQEKERQSAQKQAEVKRKAQFDRDEEFRQIVKQFQTEVDELGNPVYKNRQEAIAAAMDEYAPREQLWRQEYELPPLYAFQNEADSIRNAPQPPPGRTPGVNPYRKQPVDMNRQPPAGMADSLAARSGDRMTMSPPAPSETKAQIESLMGKAAEGKDQATAVALQTIKALTEKYGGSPPAGTQEMTDFMFAYKLLKDKGISIQAKRKTSSGAPRPFEHGFPGM